MVFDKNEAFHQAETAEDFPQHHNNNSNDWGHRWLNFDNRDNASLLPDLSFKIFFKHRALELKIIINNGFTIERRRV